MNTENINMKLQALGSEGALETLDCVKKLGWATASDVAKSMDTHIATAVKRLNLLHEAGFLERRVRRGKTRSAQEYSLRSTKIILELDLENGEKQTDIVFLSVLLRDILARFGRFGGRTVEEVLCRWKRISGADDKINIWLESGTVETLSVKPETMLEFISTVLAAEAAEYGELTVKALARASLDAVKSTCEASSHELPSRFFGGE